MSFDTNRTKRLYSASHTTVVGNTPPMRARCQAIDFSYRFKLSTRIRIAAILITMCLAILASGCSSTQYKRMVYDALRQQDCLINQLDSFCNRTFALDFYDYTVLRRDYINGLTDQPKQPDNHSDENFSDILLSQNVVSSSQNY